MYLNEIELKEEMLIILCLNHNLSQSYLQIFDQESFIRRICLLTCFILYLYTLLVWVSVRMFVTDKRQYGTTDQTQIFCGTSHDPRKGSWTNKIVFIFF